MAGEVDSKLSDEEGIQQKTEAQCRSRLILNPDNTRRRDPFKCIQLWG